VCVWYVCVHVGCVCVYVHACVLPCWCVCVCTCVHVCCLVGVCENSACPQFISYELIVCLIPPPPISSCMPGLIPQPVLRWHEQVSSCWTSCVLCDHRGIQLLWYWQPKQGRMINIQNFHTGCSLTPDINQLGRVNLVFVLSMPKLEHNECQIFHAVAFKTQEMQYLM